MQPCSRCGSKKWRRDPSGQYACEQGHQYTVEEEQDEEGGYVAGQRRSIRKKKPRAKAPASKPSSTKSSKPQSLLYESLQYGLHLQALSLANDHGCPPEIVDIVRDLWVIWASGDPSVTFTDRKAFNRTWMSAASDGMSTVGSVSGPTASRRIRPDCGPMRPNLQEYNKPYISAQITLVFCRMACRMLGIPILMGDLVRWAVEGSLPFMDVPYKTPIEIRRNYKWQSKYDRSIPSVYMVRKLRFNVVLYFHKTHNLPFGDPMPPAVVVRLLKLLRLPVGIYPHYKALRKIREASAERVDPRTDELECLACLLIAAKMFAYSKPSIPIQMPDRKEFDRLLSFSPPSTSDIERAYLQPGVNAWLPIVSQWIRPLPKSKAIVAVFDEHIQPTPVQPQHGSSDATARRSVVKQEHGAGNDADDRDAQTQQSPMFANIPKDEGSLAYFPSFDGSDAEGDLPVLFAVHVQICANLFYVDCNVLLTEIQRLEELFMDAGDNE
ncbi:hypothetical protein BC831DRAFT_480378 [Entophlyctis helioformis]|nr:hypothetical protein BC831DRAFT_480378 [Entophlyctis helioformis]